MLVICNVIELSVFMRQPCGLYCETGFFYPLWDTIFWKYSLTISLTLEEYFFMFLCIFHFSCKTQGHCHIRHDLEEFQNLESPEFVWP